MTGLYLALIAFWAWFCLAFSHRPMRAFWLAAPLLVLGLTADVLRVAHNLLGDFCDLFDDEAF